MAAAFLLPGLAQAQTAAHIVTVTGPAALVTEGGNAVFTFSLTSPAAGQPNARTADLTATFSITGTATAGSDYTAPSPLSVTFPSGNNADQTVSITATDDTLNEASETLILTLTGVTDGDNAGMFPGGTDAQGSATGTIADNDDITYELGAAFSTFSEGDPGDLPVVLTYTVTLTGAASGSAADITIPYSFIPSDMLVAVDATAGEDFTIPSPQTVTIPAGATSANIEISFIPDNLNEAQERVVIGIGSPPVVEDGGGGVSRTTNVGRRAVIHAVDDDDPITVSLLPPPDVDPDTTGIQVFEASDAVFTVMLSGPSQGDVIVNLRPNTMGSGTSSTDFSFPGSVVVPAGMTSLPVRVSIVYDGMDETGEMLQVILSLQASPGTGMVSRSTTMFQHTIALVDTQGGVLISPTTLTVAEQGGTTMTYTAQLRSDPAAQTVTITPSISAGGDAFVSLSGGVLTFTTGNWNTAQSVTVTALSDGNLIDDTVTISHAVSGGGDYAAISSADHVTVRVLDAGAMPAVTIDPTLLTITEAGASGTYTVVLTTDPGASVVVTAGRVAGGNLAVGAGSLSSQASVNLTFDSATWNTPQTVSVGAGHDANTMGAGDDTGTITHAVTGYGSVSTAAPVIVTIQDDDPDTMPSLSAVDDQTYTIDVAITPLTLPDSVGDGTVNYALTPAVGTALPGLSFDANTRVLSGTPTAVTPTPVTLTYTATDTDGAANAAAQTFMVTVASRIDVAALDEVNEMILPEVARALAGQHAGAVTTRVRQAGQSGGGGSGSFNFGGQSKLSSMAARHAQTLADDGVDMKRLLGDSDFVLPLGGGGLGGTSLAMWGAGDYHNIGGESKDGGTQWDGDLFGAHLGLDARLRPNLLAGLMMSYNKADIDYESATQTGEYELDMNSVNPYLGWSAFDGRLDIWATVGYGSGDLEVTPDDQDSLSSDVTTQTFGFGGGGLIRKNGEREWRLNAEAFHTRTEIDGADRNAAATQLPELKVDATRLRLMLETRHPRTLSSGAGLTPSAEIGMRQDSGDGRTGAGVEAGGGVQYKDALRNLTLEVNARALLAHSGDYEDWGINGKIRLQPGADGQGASLTLTPAYGNTAATAKAIWDNGSLDTDDTKDTPLQAQLDARAGYGLNLESGLLTPYTEMTLRESSQTYRLGVQWDVTRSFDLELVGEREQADDKTDGHTVVLKGEMSF